jgi:hypothetical protein
MILFSRENELYVQLARTEGNDFEMILPMLRMPKQKFVLIAHKFAALHGCVPLVAALAEHYTVLLYSSYQRKIS